MFKRDLKLAFDWYFRNDFKPFFYGNERIFIKANGFTFEVSKKEIQYRAIKEKEYQNSNWFKFLAK